MRLFPLLAALLCMVMLMGCTTHAEPESNKLTEAELQELQELFAPGSWYGCPPDCIWRLLLLPTGTAAV